MSNETVTRAYLRDSIHKKVGFSLLESTEFVDTIIEEMIDAISEDHELKMPSFGTFKVREKAQRIGRNPKTKQEVPIPARKSVSFYVSSMLKKRINESK